jgi:hypothetical protein
MWLQCKRCKKVWNYTGKKKYDPNIPSYTSCPGCKTAVRIKPNEELEAKHPPIEVAVEEHVKARKVVAPSQ